MPVETIYNTNFTSPTNTGRVEFTNVGSGIFQIYGSGQTGFAPIDFKASTLEIWDAASGGAQLTVNTDYTLEYLNEELTSKAGYNVNAGLKVITGGYQTGSIWIDCDIVGQEVAAEVVNELQDQITTLSVSTGWVTKTVTSSTYTVTDGDMTNYNEIMFDTTSNSITITLPDRATENGKKIKLSHAIQGSTNIVTINCAGSDTITQDALTSIELPKEGNYVELFASSITSDWTILSESITCTLRLDEHAGFGSTDTYIERFTNSRENVGNMFSENHSTGYNSNTEGLEITINHSGKYSITYTKCPGTGGDRIGITLNSSELTTPLLNLTTKSSVLCMQSTNVTGLEIQSSITKYFSKSDVLRPHVTVVASPTTAANCFITVEYLGQ